MKTKERGGGAYVTFKSGVMPNIPRAFDLIASGGFQPRKNEVDLIVTGQLSKENDTIVVTLDGMKTPARFVLLPSNDKGDSWYMQAKELASKSAPVEVEGRWQPNADPQFPAALRVMRVEMKKNALPLKEKATVWGGI